MNAYLEDVLEDVVEAVAGPDDLPVDMALELLREEWDAADDVRIGEDLAVAWSNPGVAALIRRETLVDGVAAGVDDGAQRVLLGEALLALSAVLELGVASAAGLPLLA